MPASRSNASMPLLQLLGQASWAHCWLVLLLQSRLRLCSINHSLVSITWRRTCMQRSWTTRWWSFRCWWCWCRAATHCSSTWFRTANTPLSARPSTTLQAKRSTKLLAFSTSVIRAARQSIALRAKAMLQRLIFRAPCCTTGSMFRSAASKQAWSITFVKILRLLRPMLRRRFKLQSSMCW